MDQTIDDADLQQIENLLPEPPLLTKDERLMLSKMSSIEFGFFSLAGTDKLHETIVVQKALRHYESLIKEYNTQESTKSEVDIKPDVSKLASDPTLHRKLVALAFLRLGHLHLLSEDWVKALSAYHRYYDLARDAKKDIQFYYGLGQVYFHFRAYSVLVE